jgi:hypothetical protein
MPMYARSLITPLLAAFYLALPLEALAMSDRWHGDWKDRGPESRLVDEYEKFAGSEANARSLVTGLRNDSQIKLSGRGGSANFNPPTEPMGYGNVDKALALAQAALAEQGIHKPTPEQIKTALMGGKVTDSSGKQLLLPGVLKLRAAGMGWGEIAHKQGMNLGEVMRNDNGSKPDERPAHKKRHDKDDDDDDRKHDRKHAHKKHKDDDGKNHHKHAHKKPDHKHAEWKRDHKPEFRAKHEGRPEKMHPASYERTHYPKKIDRPEKWERAHKPERPERPERHGRRS